MVEDFAAFHKELRGRGIASWPKDFLQRVKRNFEASQTSLAPRYPFYVNALSVASMEGSSAYGKPVTDPVSHRPSLPCD